MDRIPPEPLEPLLRRQILKLGHAYAKARGITLSTAGMEIRKASNWFTSLASKRPPSFTMRIYDAVIREFYRRWPADKPMPHEKKR